MFPSSNILYFEVYLDRKCFDNVDIILVGMLVMLSIPNCRNMHYS
jgi:hypothetical protein